MKQSQMNPSKGVAWRVLPDGGARKVQCGAWSFTDATDRDGLPVRTIVHYGMVLGQFRGSHPRTPLWRFQPVSVGWGSVSDQQGMNRIVGGMSGWYFSRAGGDAGWVQRG